MDTASHDIYVAGNYPGSIVRLNWQGVVDATFNTSAANLTLTLDLALHHYKLEAENVHALFVVDPLRNEGAGAVVQLDCRDGSVVRALHGYGMRTPRSLAVAHESPVGTLYVATEVGDVFHFDIATFALLAVWSLSPSTYHIRSMIVDRSSTTLYMLDMSGDIVVLVTADVTGVGWNPGPQQCALAPPASTHSSHYAAVIVGCAVVGGVAIAVATAGAACWAKRRRRREQERLLADGEHEEAEEEREEDENWEEQRERAEGKGCADQQQAGDACFADVAPSDSDGDSTALYVALRSPAPATDSLPVSPTAHQLGLVPSSLDAVPQRSSERYE